MCDCINIFNTCTFENIYKIEDEFYSMKLIFNIIE